MSENLDYDKLKFKCGLEIHQQLDSNKLFCSCPSILRKDEPSKEIVRKLHAVAGESGEIDLAVKYQASLDKEFVYQYYNDTNCLVELDEEPPHEINLDALKTALHLALLLNCQILPIIQIMRKTVIDGSNTSGFQRTLLLAHSGFVETPSGRVGIQNVCLEEDAARIVSKEDGKTIYRLDRLGIPLVEIATNPDIKNPEQAKEVALYIGNILRSCKVKRGIGTIRQDVNLSILNGNRVELKGVQDMDIFLDVLKNEVLRQKKILDSGQKVSSEVRNALPNSQTEFLRPMPGSSRMYPETDLPLLKISRDIINDAKKSLPKLKSEIAEDLKKQGLNNEMISLLLKEEKVDEYLELFKILPSPLLIGKILLFYPKEIANRLNKTLEEVLDILNNDVFSSILLLVKSKKISEENIKTILERLVSGQSFESAIIFDKKDLSEIQEKIIKIIKEKPGLSANAYMGLIMKEFKGQISGKEIMEILNKLKI